MATKGHTKTLTPLQAIKPSTFRTASVNGANLDLQGYESASVLLNAGTITDGTFTPKFQEADDNGSGAPDTWSDVAATDLTDGPFVALVADSVQQVGYRGTKRWLRVVVTASGSPATGAEFSAIYARGHPHDA